MRASLLTLALSLLAASACTQSNVQLPPFYDASSGSTGDGSASDASDDVTTPTGDGASEAAVDGPVGDAPLEASSDGGNAEGASEGGGSTDAGDGGSGD
jgi:hypothetical protein